MNNKGLTVVELVVSFVLSVVVALFLVEIVFILKDAYISVGAKSVLLNKQAVISNRINNLLEGKTIVSAEYCGENCVTFTFDDTLKETIYVDVDSKTISIGDYVNKLPESAVLKNLSIYTVHTDNVAVGNNNSILKISIPIEDSLVENYNFDIKVIHQYDNRKYDWSLISQDSLYMKLLNMVPSTNNAVSSENGQIINLGKYGIRYQGTDPDNYIYFNCENYSNQTSETCETWRIIGVVDGKVKIISEEIGTMAWDADVGGVYDNNWNDSSLKTYLNGESEGDYYASLTEATRNSNYISPSTWYLRGHNTTRVTKDVMYNLERTNGSVYDTNPPQIENTKIGLMYPSDLAYAAMETESCLATTILYDYDPCKPSNWISQGSTNRQWFIAPHSNLSGYAFLAYADGSVGYYYVYDSIVVRVVLHLSSETLLANGNGTENEPYQISVD